MNLAQALDQIAEKERQALEKVVPLVLQRKSVCD